MANTVGFWDSVVEKPVRLGCCWSCREGPGGSVSCRVAVTLGSPPFPSSFHGPCTVDPRGSQTLAQLGDQAGGCPAGRLGSYGPYLYNPLLPVPAPPCWRLSVRTAPSPCWTRACLRCKCKEEHWDQALGPGTGERGGGWLAPFSLQGSALPPSRGRGDGSRLPFGHHPASGAGILSPRGAVCPFPIKNHSEMQPVRG